MSDFCSFLKYTGKPWIWCTLHNFGGTNSLYGRLPVIATAPLQALGTAGVTMVGVGITMEGINQNYGRWRQLAMA